MATYSYRLFNLKNILIFSFIMHSFLWLIWSVDLLNDKIELLSFVNYGLALYKIQLAILFTLVLVSFSFSLKQFRVKVQEIRGISGGRKFSIIFYPISILITGAVMASNLFLFSLLSIFFSALFCPYFFWLSYFRRNNTVGVK